MQQVFTNIPEIIELCKKMKGRSIKTFWYYTPVGQTDFGILYRGIKNECKNGVLKVEGNLITFSI